MMPILHTWFFLTCVGSSSTFPLCISSFSRDGTISWSNAYPTGVVSVLSSKKIEGPWQPWENYFTTNETGRSFSRAVGSNAFYRLLAVDISTHTPFHYTNLVKSYGILETVAGLGRKDDESNQWRPEYEGGWATNACLSRPHIAFGDSRGNVLIVDQRSSSVLKVTPEGRIHTYAGTHTAGYNGDGPDYATNLHLNNPNGGWLGTGDVFYVLDTDNARLRKILTNGTMMTLFTASNTLGDGRALWVKGDESQVCFGSGRAIGASVTTLNQWKPSAGFSVLRSGFGNLGNIVGDENTGDLYISDRGANRVYRLDSSGRLIPIAGNGTTSGGGDGFPALQTGLIQPRSVAFLPNGGYFISEHSPGNRVWYVDQSGIIHLWLNGSDHNHYRVGDDQWFFANPTLPKVSRVRSVIPDPYGHLIIVESNYGYVRRIQFRRLSAGE